MKKAVLCTLAYADVFNYPLLAPEVLRFLIGRRKTGIDTVQKELSRMDADSELIDADGELYFLRGRGEIVALRKKRKKESQKKLAIAQRVARWLNFIPTIKMVAVTGALAMKNSQKEDDIDLLIVTSKNRLWLTRLLTVLLIEVVSQRRRPGDKKFADKVCLNMFLDEAHLAIPVKERDLFSAHEVCQMKALWSKDGIYERFLGANRWVAKYLPNGMRTEKQKNKKTEKQKGLSVSRFLSLFVDPLERLASQFQLAYMRPRKTTEITEPGRLRFHPKDARGWVLPEYKKRLKELGIE